MQLYNNTNPSQAVQHSDDVCALPIVRRLGATFDIDPGRWREGDALPRGWHLAFFTTDTRQSQLRPDGVAGFGIALPDLGLPRIVFGGRRITFHGDIPIGAHLRRETRLVSVLPKEGRSGRFAVATIQHEIFVKGALEPAVVELQDQVMREAASDRITAHPAQTTAAGPAMPEPVQREIVVPDETLLFRVSALMFNTHRIHFDLAYAREHEAYPALVVNGSVSSLLLLEFFRARARREPNAIHLRNVGLAFCGRPLRLNAIPGDASWRVWADDEQGNLVVEGTMG